MLRIIILLIGADPFRREWHKLPVIGTVLILIGIASVLGLAWWLLIVVSTLFGLICVIEGLVSLADLSVVRRKHRLVLLLSAGALIALGGLAMRAPVDNSWASTVFFGIGFLIDGMLRTASAHVIRFNGFKRSMLIGVGEILVSIQVFTGWPIEHLHVFPVCFGILLIAYGIMMCRLGLEFRELPEGVSVLSMPYFRRHNWYWYEKLPIHAAPAKRPFYPLMVHVWTPVGSTPNPQRRAIVDRYIAAVDRSGKVSTGHSSLELPPDLYISLYPGVESFSEQQFKGMLLAHKENDIPGRFLESYEAEVADWCEPNRQIWFRNYNEEALRTFWDIYRRDVVYNLSSRNCSTTVALALDVALEGIVGRTRPWYRFFILATDPNVWLLSLLRTRGNTMTWTPGLILDYARVLRRVSEFQRERWLVRMLHRVFG
ncbi:HdeD family acid-resistance protein [Silvimonas iriomotensis]|uniref:DUF308 domain-containing protein n=1 Tax=Silvimonas iriomotensis TaxID=449662 RepID=A0ABQ2PC27_9NEIS|nr:protease [Silvimonas iriomotensis]GGP22771.1 hypothetical protein GCM10010970_27710 [Silvimonas iriomotensis]